MDKISNRQYRKTLARTLLVLCLLPKCLQSFPAVGAEDLDEAEATRAAQGARYADCMTLAQSEPDAAWERANAWLSLDGGNAAEHCAAVALITMGYHREAAQRLEDLAAHLRKPYERLLPEILAQAAQAWFLAGDYSRAYGVQTAALEKAPGDVELLIDRSMTAAAANDYSAAVQDLDRAHVLAPNRADILIYRASAKRIMNAPIAARSDINLALELDRENPEALLERGLLNRLSGNDEAAREDWLRTILLAEETPTAEAARRYLEHLDLSPE